MSEPSAPASPVARAAGKIWIISIFAIGSGLGIFASYWWSQPDHAVAGSFTQIHTAFLRGPKDKAQRLLAPRISWDGREVSADEFLAAYTVPPNPTSSQVTPCAATAGHWVMRVDDRRFCFFREGKTWKLHWLQNGDCACR